MTAPEGGNDWASVAEQYARKAMGENVHHEDGQGATRKVAFALTSIAASLVHQANER